MSGIYIIGNGHSMHDFNYTKLDGKECIVINDGFMKKTDAKYMLFSDDWFYQMHKDADPKHDFWRFKGEIYSDSNLVKNHPRIKPLGKYTKLKGKKPFDASSMNTGIKAILFAHAMGYEKIYLLGFDNKPLGRTVPKQPVYDRYYGHHKELAKFKLPIVNLTPDSALDMYETDNFNGV